MREVVVGVKFVGQGDLRKVRQFGGDDFGQRSAEHCLGVLRGMI